MNIKASLLMTALLASTSCFAADTYQVTSSVYAQGKLVAAPKIVVEPNKSALITIGNNFSYNLTVKPNQDETADVAAVVTVDDNTINPSFTVAYDKQATIEIGTQKLTILVSKVGS